MRSSVFRRILIVLCIAALPLAAAPSAVRAQVSIGVSINVAPPALPVYVQPELPAPGYIWVPGYWAWGAYGYYWVPGTWVAPPQPGLLWTPGYWGWVDGNYGWHAGYWGPTVGFYGGVNYGFGYTGHGYWGGQWRGGTFVYNRSVTNVTNVNVTNVYNQTVVNGQVTNHVSFNGGPGGVVAQPNQAELAAARQHHIASTPMQQRHIQMAAGNPQLRASANGGRPAIAATARPAVFSGRGVIAAHAAGGAVHPAAVHTAEHHNAAPAHDTAPPHPVAQLHASAPRPAERAAAPRTPQPEHHAQPPHPRANPQGGREAQRPQKDDNRGHRQ